MKLNYNVQGYSPQLALAFAGDIAGYRILVGEGEHG